MTDTQGQETVEVVQADRPYPDLLTVDEEKELLAIAEDAWSRLQSNDLGGFAGINRPFWIVAQMKAVIEKLGRRDIGQTWSKNDLDAARHRITSTQPVGEVDTLREAEKRGAALAIARLTHVARAIAWQAGVGGRETAGAIVSYLATSPDEIEPFVMGTLSPLDFQGDWMRGGCLTWHAANGKVVDPAALSSRPAESERASVGCTLCGRAVLADNLAGTGFLADCGRRLAHIADALPGGCQQAIEAAKAAESERVGGEASDDPALAQSPLGGV